MKIKTIKLANGVTIPGLVSTSVSVIANNGSNLKRHIDMELVNGILIKISLPGEPACFTSLMNTIYFHEDKANDAPVESTEAPKGTGKKKS